jgi:hypothetical protein
LREINVQREQNLSPRLEIFQKIRKSVDNDHKPDLDSAAADGF